MFTDTEPKAFLFDMDGTLTDARQLITKDVVDQLRSINGTAKKYLVTGSDMGKIEEQIPNGFHNHNCSNGN